VCMHCGQPSTSGDPVRRDQSGFLLHFRCGITVHSRANEWSNAARSS
jgi:hypothetical protein